MEAVWPMIQIVQVSTVYTYTLHSFSLPYNKTQFIPIHLNVMEIFIEKANGCQKYHYVCLCTEIDVI